MSDTFFNPDLTYKPGGDTVGTMGFGGLSDLPDTPSEVTTYDTGVADYLKRGLPVTDITTFVGTPAQIAEIFPGVQMKPEFVPGLTDITYTRGYYGPTEGVLPEAFGTESQGHLFWSPYGFRMDAQTTVSSSVTTSVDRQEDNNLDSQDQQFDIGQPDQIGEQNSLQKLFDLFSEVSVGKTEAGQEYLLVPEKTNLALATTTAAFENIYSDDALLNFLKVYLKTAGEEGKQVYQTEQTRLAEKAAAEEAARQAEQARQSEVIQQRDTELTRLDDLINRYSQGEEFYKSKEQAYQDEELRKAAAEQARLAEEARLAAEAERQRILEEQRQAEQAAAQEQARQQAAAQEAERQRLAAEEQARQQAAAEEARQAELARQAEADRQAAAAAEEAERQRLAAVQPQQLEAAKQGISALANNESVRIWDSYKSDLDKKLADLNAKRNEISGQIFSSQGKRMAPNSSLLAALSEVDNAIASTTAFKNNFGSMVTEAGGSVLSLLANPDLPIGDVLKDVFTDAIGTLGADTVASMLGEQGTELFAQAAGLGLDAVSGGIPVAQIVMDIAAGKSAGTVAANAAKAYAIAQIALIPGVGPWIAAAAAIDSVLSSVLGYRSPISEGVNAVAKNVDKAISWVGNAVSDVGRSISSFFGRLGFEEGGLVDLGDDLMYNYNDYGPLADLPYYEDQVLPQYAFAGGGLIPLVGGGKIATGPGGGLDDLIPTTIDGKRAAALSDGEFVIPADVVSMMGDGSSNAGAKRLYDLVRQIRHAKTGTEKQAGPLPVGKILERTMK